jgi:hypothetical protein
MRPLHLALCLTLTLDVVGCSDDSVGNTDTRATNDRAADRPTTDGPPPVIPEAGLPDMPLGPCEQRCLAEGINLCVTDPASGLCVECLEDKHCTENIGALGSKCDKGRQFCICDSDAECASNYRGPICDTGQQTCTCKTNSDCKVPLSLCSGGTLKTCRRPCVIDADCKLAAAPRCHKSGECVPCLADLDCATSKGGTLCGANNHCVHCKTDTGCSGATPHCSAGGQCVACTSAAQCAGSLDGALCINGSCSCNGDGDCKAATAWGSTCLTAMVPHRCGCASDGGCAGKAPGPTCYTGYKKCSCASDASCAVAPYSKCGLPYDVADYLTCQQPCGSDAECQARPGAHLSKCDGGRCVACTVDGDCALSPQGKLCLTSHGACVQCKSDGDCGGAPCDTVTGRCVECKSGPDCVGRPGGVVCAAGRCGCSTDADCAGGYVWGRTCQAIGTATRCGCAAAGDCSGVGTGPTCDLAASKCSCTSDAQCASPVSACSLPLPGAAYLQCAKPCAADGDCAARPGLPKCSGQGKCVQCKIDGDCSGSKKLCGAAGVCVSCKSSADCASAPWAKVCDVAIGCVECLTDTDCGAASLGKTCSGGLCTCGSDADCAGRLSGKRCDKVLDACGCVTDNDCIAPRTCTGVLGATGKLCQ